MPIPDRSARESARIIRDELVVILESMQEEAERLRRTAALVRQLTEARDLFPVDDLAPSALSLDAIQHVMETVKDRFAGNLILLTSIRDENLGSEQS